MYPNIDQKLGLHQEVQIIYVVDGYVAVLYGDDDCTWKVDTGRGPTVAEALADLDKNLATQK